jgi:hypothetical protein
MANASSIIGRMQFLLEKTKPTPEKINMALTKISMMIIAKAKIKIRQKRIVDRGHLINSMRWELYRSGNVYGSFIGSFGVKYAAMNEFGGIVTQRQFRAMMAALADRPRLPSKGVVVRAGAAWRWKPRPYLRPAVIESQRYILETLRKEL